MASYFTLTLLWVNDALLYVLFVCPVGHDGRRMYDRDFLISFKSLCVEKPQSLERTDLFYDNSRMSLMMGIGPMVGGGGPYGTNYGKNDRRVRHGG